MKKKSVLSASFIQMATLSDEVAVLVTLLLSSLYVHEPTTA
jgi:hypothetical protein